MWLNLKNTIDGIVWSFEVEDSTPNSEYYYFKDLNIPEDMPDGEYEYSLMYENILLATGLLRLGNYKTDVKSYEITTKTKQYRY